MKPLLHPPQMNYPAIGLGTNWGSVFSSTETNPVPVTVDTANGAVFFRLVHP